MLLSISEILKRVPVSRTTLHFLRKKPDFPAPVKIGDRVFYLEEDIVAYVNSLQNKVG